MHVKRKVWYDEGMDLRKRSAAADRWVRRNAGKSWWESNFPDLDEAFDRFTSTFTRSPRPKQLGTPLCAKCRRPVSRLIVEPENLNTRITVLCHGDFETMLLTPQQLLDMRSGVKFGEAFRERELAT